MFFVLDNNADVSICQDNYQDDDLENVTESYNGNEDSKEEDNEEHWGINDEDILKDFYQQVDNPESNNQRSVFLLKFLLLWASFYGISATTLNHLIKSLHYILSLMSVICPQVASILTIFPAC